MKPYLMRWSTLSSLLGMIAGIAFFLPAVIEETLGPAEIRNVVIGFFALFFSFVLTAFFQHIEVESVVRDDLREVTPVAKLLVPARDCVVHLSQAADELSRAISVPGGHSRITSQASRLTGSLLADSRELANGRFRTPFWSCDILRCELEKMSEGLLGYSPLLTEKERDWWQSPEGEKFFELNRRILKKRPWSITRIFCVPDDIAQVEAELRRHHDIKVNVHYLTKDQIPPIQHPYDASAAVIDARIAYLSCKNSGGEDRNQWFCHPDDVAKQKSILDKLLLKATQYPATSPRSKLNQ